VNRLLIEITGSYWLIDKERANGYAALFLSLLKGEKASDIDFSQQRAANKSFVVNAANKVGRYELSDTNIPEGSTAVIPIRGEIMKYDQSCGPRGTMTITNEIKQADSNPKIASIILVVDSPGGQVSHTDILAEAVASSKTPIITYIEGMAASAAYWIISGSKKIIASSKLDKIGSIGTMLSFADMQPYYEAQGVVFHEIYATKSTDKNKDINEVIDGKYDNYIKNTLDPINEQFHASVKSNRPDLKKEVLTGKLYFANDAIGMGLIDEIGSMDYAIEEASRIANEQNINSKTNTIDMKIKMNAAWVAIASFFGFDSAKENELTEESIEKLNGELQSRGDKITQLETDLQAANAAKVTAEQNLAASESALAETTRQFEAFKASDADDEAKAKKEKDELASQTAAKFDNADYNKAADKL
jgi:protease-4